MKNHTAFATCSLLAAAMVVACDEGSTPTEAVDQGRPAFAAQSRTSFGFKGTVSGFPTGAVFLTGGGSYDASTASNVIETPTTVASAGGFRCTATIAQGPLAGCAAGEGVRWDTVQLLESTTFTCTGSDAVKTATTDENTVVLLADFYRAGDGIDESFTAQIIVSDTDIAPDIPGVQTLWVQGVGCGDAITHFSQ
jgi:hypothetical protein